MKLKILLLLAVLLSPLSAGAIEFTDDFREVIRLYINTSDQKKFYLNENCPAGESYYTIIGDDIDINAYYSTIMAAFLANKEVRIGYERSGTECYVRRIEVKK